MSDAASGTFGVKIVFRGLFLASREKDRIDILLPDATSPGAAMKAEASKKRRALLEALQPLREHHAVVEFPLADWDNRSELTPRVVQVHKPTKEPVALCLLSKETIEFRGLHDDPNELPSPLKVDSEKAYRRVGDVLLLANHPEFGWNQLSGFESAIDRQAAGLDGGACVATTTIRFGEVYSERRSLRGTKARQWRSVSVLSDDYLDPKTRVTLKLPKPSPDSEPRMLNLDLVVRFRLRDSNPLVVFCRPQQTGPIPRSFILRPRVPGGEVTVWVKNRELDAILQDSDLVPDPFQVDMDNDATDRDHAVLMRLAKDPAKLRVPRDHNDDASDSGSGCGGSVRPPIG